MFLSAGSLHGHGYSFCIGQDEAFPPSLGHLRQCVWLASTTLRAIFAGDQVRNAQILLSFYNRDPAMQYARDFLDREDTQ